MQFLQQKMRDVLIERVDSTVDRENPLVKLVLFLLNDLTLRKIQPCVLDSVHDVVTWKLVKVVNSQARTKTFNYHGNLRVPPQGQEIAGLIKGLLTTIVP